MPGMKFVGEASVLVAQPNATKHNRLGARCCFERFSKVEKRQFHAGENEREKTKERKRENEERKTLKQTKRLPRFANSQSVTFFSQRIVCDWRLPAGGNTFAFARCRRARLDARVT